ncbi:UvrD-helicase domain-containing protein [uncultured Campylobacter sp.]|uniref:ATP-dependent helicase n=1 Tax=uncultured Campylobacter sp. TaxID=218934 RepID=UPI002622D304|nr:UvrD-helicase domain-containing protein [uncultured Campylobacter sp.]
MNLFDGLNERQREAASHIDGALLILAGAGSGKTKTITTRLAYLIDEVGISPNNTLTLTFTNKAAHTMKKRALSMMRSSYSPLLCTFHKFALLFLKLHIDKLGLQNAFKVIDADDSKKIIKELLSPEVKLSPYQAADMISNFKNSLISVEKAYEHLEKNTNPNLFKNEYIKLYKLYQESLKKYSYLDFDDLLLMSYELLKSDGRFASEQSKLYQYITVDEYQDTNSLQYEILKLLCKEHSNLCVVGDDDQSIYSWRGARIENILNFTDDFKDAKIVKLEHNYRSSAKILDAANKLISNNTKRLGKILIPTKDKGDDIIFLKNENDKDEAAEIVRLIRREVKNGTKLNEIAVLYRRNSLSSILDNELRKEKIPYKILSGLKFHERLEIKDAVAYLRLISNTNDDFSFKRIINVPKRGLGKAFVSKLEHYAKINKISLFDSIFYCLENGIFSKEISARISEFALSILDLQKSNLSDIIKSLEDVFALSSVYDEDYKQENLQLLYKEFQDSIKRNSYKDLNDLLSDFSLQGEQDNINENEDCVYLMSVHASKGLEFDVVFVIGLENGNFPISLDNEEERRLAYVAITRAKKKLFLSTASTRNVRTSVIEGSSVFLEELNLLDEKIHNNTNFKKGDLVQHKIFGIGRILDLRKEGKDIRLDIIFGGITRNNILSDALKKI